MVGDRGHDPGRQTHGLLDRFGQHLPAGLGGRSGMFRLFSLHHVNDGP